MSKAWFCPNCKNRKTTNDDVKYTMCRCGDWYEGDPITIKKEGNTSGITNG